MFGKIREDHPEYPGIIVLLSPIIPRSEAFEKGYCYTGRVLMDYGEEEEMDLKISDLASWSANPEEL